MARFGRVCGAANSSRIERRKEKEDSSTLVFPKVVSPLEDSKSVSLYDAGVTCGFGVLDQTVHPGLVIGNTTVFLPFPSDLELLLQGIDRDGQLGDSSVFVLNNSQFKINNFKWNSSLMDLFNMFIRNYRWGRLDIDFGNSRLLILPAGSSFHHKPIKPTQNHLGSLMIGLPSLYKGGKVICYENDSEHPTFTKETSEFYEFDYITYLSEMNLEIEPITSGIRIYLIYPLILFQQSPSYSSTLPSISLFSETSLIIENSMIRSLQNDTPLKLNSKKIEELVDRDYQLISLLLELNNKFIGTTNEIEIWIHPKEKGKYNCYKCVLQNGKVQIVESPLIKFFPRTYKYTEYYDSSDYDTAMYKEVRDCSGPIKGVIIKKSSVLNYMQQICKTKSIVEFMCSDTYYTNDTIYQYINSLEEKKLFKLEYVNCKPLFCRFLVDTDSFINIFERIFNNIDICIDMVNDFGGIFYDSSLKYNLLDYNESMLKISNSNQVLCLKSSTDWNKYYQYFVSNLPVMMKLPNGVIVQYDLSLSTNGDEEILITKFNKVFFHPDFNIIQHSVNQKIRNKFTTLIPLYEFCSLVPNEKLIDYLEISHLITLVKPTYFYSNNIRTYGLVNLINEKFWTTFQNELNNIVKELEFNNLMKFIFLLYASKDKFKQNVANGFIPMLIEKMKTKDSYSLSKIAAYFLGICCYTNSFEIAELAHKLDILSALSDINTKNSLMQKMEDLHEDIEEWHKYFVKERLKSLINQVKELNTDFNQSNNTSLLDSKKSRKTKVPSSKQYKKKQELEKAIDKLKETYPYLHLGKRPVSSPKESNPKKKSKAE